MTAFRQTLFTISFSTPFPALSPCRKVEASHPRLAGGITGQRVCCSKVQTPVSKPSPQIRVRVTRGVG